ncbi:MAG: tetratricopeptide repeat protein [Candidatus Rokubacteria bacterium]|nr:tetratricopeptide repeat protein [Candidatus Rokubacteria bacterium]
MTRLNGLLATLLLVLVAGPPAVRWALERWVAPPAPPRPLAARQPPRAPVATSAPAPELAPSVPAEGPDAALAREAYTLYQEGRVAEACERYRVLVARMESEEARRNLGSCLARLGRDAYEANRTELAVQHYQRAIEADPGTPGLRAALATAHVKAQNLAGAQAVLERGVRTFPDDAELLYLLAEVQERQGRTRDAAESLRRLLGTHPEHARGRALLAVVEREQKVERDYWTQESQHFLVRYEGATGLDLARSVVDLLEQAYDSIGRDLRVFPPDRIQVGIYSAEVLEEFLGVPGHYVRGAFDGRKIRLNLAESATYANDLSRLVRHEYAHLIIHQASKGRAPTWVHEGLAQVMEPRTAARSLRVNLPREVVTLGGIERLSRSPSARERLAGYILTHVAVEYLLDHGGLGKMREFLARLGEGEPIETALRQSFGIGLDEVEARLLAVAGRG